MSLKESIDKILPQAYDSEDVGLPSDDEWFGDSAKVMAIRTEMPSVKACLYDRNKSKVEQAKDVDIAMENRETETAIYSTDYLAEIMAMYDKIAGKVEVEMEEDKPIRITAEDQDGRKTVTILAPRIADDRVQ